jgi:hypothetical protein
MPVKKIVDQTTDEKFLGKEISYEQYMRLRNNYEQQNRLVNQNGVIKSDSLSAWIPITDIVTLMNNVFNTEVLKINPDFKKTGIKIYYGTHNKQILSGDVVDTVNENKYGGLHTIMLVATNENYNPDYPSNNIDDILDKPKSSLREDDSYLVDGVHLCEPNCP